MLDRRVQILLDEGRYRRLAAYARARNLSVGAAIREAIDVGIPPRESRRAAAAAAILAAEAIPVPEVPALRAELDDLRGRRG